MCEGEGEGQCYLFLHLAELSRHALQAHTRVLQLLVGGAHHAAVAVRGQTGVLQLTDTETHSQLMAEAPCSELLPRILFINLTDSQTAIPKVFSSNGQLRK